MFMNYIVPNYKEVKNSKDIIIKRLKVDKHKMRKGNTLLLALQILVSSSTCLGGCPGVQLSLLPTQIACNRFTRHLMM